MASPPSSMLTARFRGGGIIDFERTHVPQPGPGHLLLRITACALCGSDRHQLEHGSSVTPGHEAAGTVAACGPGTSTPVGTPGVVYLMDFCGACRSCRCGATNQCLAKRGDFGFSPDGGYAEYALVRETAFFATPEGIDGGTATLLLDIMGTGGHAMARAQQVHQDIRSVYVAGAGPIGLGVLAMARLLLGGDVPIAVGDVVPYRLDLAGRLGGVPVDVSAAPVVEGLRARGLDGVDAAIDTTGKEAARRDALGALAQRGVLVCVGHGEGLCVQVSADLIAPERSVLGSEYFRFDEMPANLARLMAHRPYLEQVITHRIPLAELRHAYDVFLSGQSGKVVVVP